MKKQMATPNVKTINRARAHETRKRMLREAAERVHERPPPTDAWALWVIYCAAAGAIIYLIFFARF